MNIKKLKKISKVKTEIENKILNLENIKLNNREDFISKLNFKFHIKKIKEINKGKNNFIFNDSKQKKLNKSEKFTSNKYFSVISINNKWKNLERLNINKNNFKIFKKLENIKNQNKNSYFLKNLNNNNNISGRLKKISNIKRNNIKNQINNQNIALVKRINSIKNNKLKLN